MPLFHVKHLLLAALLCSAALPASAQKMYRCPSANGGTAFSDTPCTNGQGSEVTVKPSGGAAASTAGNAPKLDTPRAAMDKRNAEYDAMLSPECRRARQAFQTKVDQKGGIEELMKEGNPISKAWEDCQFAAKDAIGKLNARDQEKVAAEERKRAEQDRIALRKQECATKQKVLDDRRPRLPQLSESDRAAFRAVENDVAINCR